MMRNMLPIVGALASVALLALAAASYPGGYDWVDQSFSSLFQPEAANGTPNAARLLAAVAVAVFCLSVGIVFARIAKHGPSKLHRDTIQIGGVGSMVYTALVVTPMHDLMVAMALLFFVAAMGAIFHWLFLERRFGRLLAGVACLSLTLSNAAMYYGDVLYGFLPIVQKVALVLWVAWLFGFHASLRASPGRMPN